MNNFNKLFSEELKKIIEPYLITQGWSWNDYAKASSEVRKIMLKDLNESQNNLSTSKSKT